MGLFDIFKSKKKNVTEVERRQFLEKSGRITDGTIVESAMSADGEEIVFYYYNIQGVDFESTEILTAEQRENPLKYTPGAKVSVKFDPKNHGNSMLV